MVYFEPSGSCASPDAGGDETSSWETSLPRCTQGWESSPVAVFIKCEFSGKIFGEDPPSFSDKNLNTAWWIWPRCFLQLWIVLILAILERFAPGWAVFSIQFQRIQETTSSPDPEKRSLASNVASIITNPPWLSSRNDHQHWRKRTSPKALYQVAGSTPAGPKPRTKRRKQRKAAPLLERGDMNEVTKNRPWWLHFFVVWSSFVGKNIPLHPARR